MKRLYALLSLLILLSGFRVAADSNRLVRIRTFGIHDGIPSHSLTTIRQDVNGIIWVATWNGAAMFDGYGFTAYRSSDRFGYLSSNRISDIETDSIGNIWLMTYDRGLHYLEPKSGIITDINAVVRNVTPKNLFTKGLKSTGRHIWAIGEGQYPTVRIDIENPADPEAYNIIIPSSLAGGASEIAQVTGDSLGNEWIFTDKGVQIYGSDLFCAGDFRHLITMPDRSEYLMTTDGSIYLYMPGATELKLAAKLPGVSEIFKAIPYGNDRIIMATDNGLATFNARTGAVVTNRINGTNSPIESIFTDSKNRVWAFTADGHIGLFDSPDRQGRLIPVDNSVKDTTKSNHSIWVEDSFGNIWAAPKDGPFGLFNYETSTLVPEVLRSPNLNYATVPLIERSFVDNQNNLWLGSSHNLTVLNLSNEYFTQIPLIPNEESRGLVHTSNGDNLISTALGSLARYNDSGQLLSYYAYTPTGQNKGRLTASSSPVRFSDHIYTMVEDREKNLWIGTKGEGVYRVTPAGDITRFRYDKNDPYSIPCDTVYHFLEDSRGNLWLATYGAGLALAQREADGNYRFISSRNEMRNYPTDVFYRMRRLAEANDGQIIASCTNGIVTFSNKFSDPSKINFYTSRHIKGDTTSLTTDNVMQSLVASDGTIYVLPLGEKPQIIDSDDLLQDNIKLRSLSTGSNIHSLMNSLGKFGNTLAMIEDKNKNINFICESTVVIYDPSTGNSHSLPFERLDQNIEFTEALPMLNPATGDIWMGLLGGALIVSPEKSVVNEYVPRIIVTGVQYQGEAEKHKILGADKIIVSPGMRNISISFAALDYPGSENIQYAYRFEDDPEWTYIYNSNTIYLNSLTPGTHKLIIRSTNSDGIWQDNDLAVDLIVKPTFAESIWARMLWAILIIAVLATLAYIYTAYRRNRMMKIMHEKEHAFFIEASHRLRTPLTLIGGPVGEVLETEHLSEIGRNHLEKVKRNSDEMLELVNSMLRRGFDDSDLVDDTTIHTKITPAEYADDEPADNAPEPQVPAESPAAKDGKRVTILIVEDNKDLLEFLSDILSKNYNVILAQNGKKGLEKAEKMQPDFIVTDITMPEMDGLTMVHHIKQNKSLSHIPIIVLSAKASVKDRVQGLNEGIDDYITKPFSATYLQQRISSIIAQRTLLQQSYFEQLGEEMKASTTSSSDNGQSGAASLTAGNGNTTGNEATAQDSAPESGPAKEYKLESPTIADTDQDMMARLLKFIESRIADENLKIEELAEAVNMGRTVFYGKIKALVGMSPSDFVRKLRMQRAEDLIVRSKMNFSQIAYNVGFSDPKYFTKCFKKETGMTPSEYRQKSSQSDSIA